MKDLLKGVVYTGIFAVPFIVLWVSSSMFFPYITGKNFAFRIIVEIMLAAWVLLALYEPQYRPKFSWMAVAGLGLLAVMFIANLFGEYSPKSFWSNYERMEGYVTLVHFYLYFIITATMLLVQKHWNWFFNTTLAVATLVCFFAFAQLSGAADISQGGTWRVDSTLGNSTYMAVYMLFHIFIAILMLSRVRTNTLRFGYGALALLFIFMLLQTGTRGAALGLVGGGILTTLYIALFAQGYPTIRKLAVGGLITLAVLVSGFIAVRETAFVQNTQVLDRLADITLAEGSIRFMIWNVAWEGIQDRPLLGWGQANFNYVFNTYYDPGLYRAEAWYDRVHNIVLDWLIAGGIIGAFFYFSIIGAALYYTIVRPLMVRVRTGKDDQTFSIIEQGLLLGILAAYVFHNLFVFDNIVSYVFFAVVLAFIHSRVAKDIPAAMRFSMNRGSIERLAAPLVLAFLIGVVYFVNVPGILAAQDIIDAFRAQDVNERFAAIERAWNRDSFGDQEIAEQVTEQASRLAANTDIPLSDKEDHLLLAENIMLTMIERKPNDPRFHIFLAGLYRAEGRFEDAAAQLVQARELTPTKPDVILEQGILALQMGDEAAMYEYFETAYTLAPTYDRTVLLYAIGLLYNNEAERLPDVVTETYLIPFAENDIVRAAAMLSNTTAAVESFFAEYVESYPESTSGRTAQALFLYGQQKDNEAIAVLEKGATDIEAFGPAAACYINNIETDAAMRTDC